MHIAFLPLPWERAEVRASNRTRSTQKATPVFSPSPVREGWGEGIKPHQANAKSNARVFSLSRGRGLG